MTELIDEEGNLFGVVNIIDALVVLFLVAVFVAGFAFVGGTDLIRGPTGEPETRYATIQIEPQSELIAGQISAGDTSDYANGNLTITDVYFSGFDGNASVIVRAEIHGRNTTGGFLLKEMTSAESTDALIRPGDSIEIETGEYIVSGQLLSLNKSNRNLPVDTTAVISTATVPVDVAESLNSGDEMRIASDRVGTLDSVRVYPTGNPEQRFVMLGLELRTLQLAGNEIFGGSPIQIGSSVRFTTGSYGISSQVIDIGTTSLDTQQLAVTVQATIPETVAESIQQGDEYTVRGRSIATVNSAEVYTTDSPDQRFVLLELQLATFERGGDQFFAGRPVTIGSALPFKTDAYSFEAEVIGQEAAEIDTSQTPVVMRTVTTAAKADDISVGDTFRTGGQTVAEIRSVEVYPTADANRKRIVMGVDLRTVGDRVQRFGGQEVKIGATLPFQASNYNLQGEVVHVGGTTFPGDPTTVRVSMKLENVNRDVANAIEPGMVERRAGTTVARVLQKRVEPVTVTVTGDAAQFETYDHPTQRNVHLTVELRVLRTESGLWFHGRSLTNLPQQDRTIVLALEPITIKGKVIKLQ